MQTPQEARAEALKDVKLYMANGWDLKEETPQYFLLTRNEASTGGHILILILTVWWTLGIGNLIYHVVSVKKKRILKSLY